MDKRYVYDSREIKPGDVYICLPKGHLYIDDAKARGASDVIEMSRKEMGKFAHKEFGCPSNSLCVIGVTGTNGKTTICHALGQALTILGYNPFVLGTLNSNLTTPESLDTHYMMADHLKQGGTHFIMEVSSHGIHQDRISGIQFSVKVLSNITQDHLDYHKSFEAYKKTKLSFLNQSGGTSIHPRDYQQIKVPSNHQFKGEFNISNLQAVIAVLMELDVSESKRNDVISKLCPPPGRFELIDEGQDFEVIVDYAHTPDGLENVLNTARHLLVDGEGKLYCVFGCGGDRDRGKRPKMGAIAERLSDVVVLTQDNPRTESEDTILKDILEGMDPKSQVFIENDRKKAILFVCEKAQKGDIVVIAGKGHETVQILYTGSIAFSDRDEVRSALRKRCENIY